MKWHIAFFLAAIFTVAPAAAQSPGDNVPPHDRQASAAPDALAREDVTVEALLHKGPQGSAMTGLHVIALTVTAVDENGGIVEGLYGKTALRLQFPPSALGVVKPGDHLQVMLGFSR
jgi:hypothetical protein